jgi:molecular chaperone IbpA
MEDVAMSTVFDFAPLSRSGIGFDRLFDMLDQATKVAPADNFPPYNIEKTGDDTYRVTVAVAGFMPDELSVTTQPNLLIVFGKKAEAGNGDYLYRGMTNAVFERRFNLADYVKVTGARLENGLLQIELMREVPEAMKPRRIAIDGGGNRPKVIENQQAA